MPPRKPADPVAASQKKEGPAGNAKKVKRPRGRPRKVVVLQETARGRGRPPKYKSEYVEQAAKFAANGWVLSEMAEFWHVTERSVYQWMADYPEFSQAIKNNRQFSDDRVEQSFYHRAVGYSCPAEKIFMTPEGAVKVRYTEHHPPDVAAGFIWLRNRRPEKWKHRKEDAPDINTDIVIKGGFTDDD
jgi:hypothetical protein